MAVLLAAPAAWAGGPGGPPGGRRGGMARGGFMGQFMQGQAREDAFHVVRRYFTLTDEQKAGLGKLEGQADTEQRAAMTELRKTLNAKYAPQIEGILPAADKEKLSKILAATAERDAAIGAAENELWTALNALRVAQGATDPEPTMLPFGKSDIIRRFMKLTDEQHKAMDETARAGHDKADEAAKAIARPQDWNDAAARGKYFEARRKAAEQVDADVADVMRVQLTDDQRKAYEPAAGVYDAVHKKIQEAQQACEKKLTELGAVPVAPARPAGAPAEAPKAPF